jgi:hypothetical protein
MHEDQTRNYIQDMLKTVWDAHARMCVAYMCHHVLTCRMHYRAITCNPRANAAYVPMVGGRTNMYMLARALAPGN